MRYPEEPHTLIGGVLVHVGAVSLLHDLLASGHDVALDPDDGVTVEPLNDLDENTLHVLEAFQEDLALLLNVGGARRTIH
jgi:hypothetical protein